MILSMVCFSLSVRRLWLPSPSMPQPYVGLCGSDYPHSCWSLLFWPRMCDQTDIGHHVDSSDCPAPHLLGFPSAAQHGLVEDRPVSLGSFKPIIGSINV